MRRILALSFLLPISALAADIKPTFTPEQAQIIINLSNAEMERACQRGNCLGAEGVLPIVKEIVRAANAPSVPKPEQPK